MSTHASEEDRLGTSPPRRFQFSLKTLLIGVTLSAILCAVATWWITLPLRTWNQFLARVNAGDVEAINAMCDQETLRVVFENRDLSKTNTDDVVEMTLPDLKDLTDKFPVPFPRTFKDVLKGQMLIFGDLEWGCFEVRRSKVAALPPPLPW